ncbi:MAG: InlB B-repeat-containing protein [Acutalibacteraceae bacterium]
MKREKGEMMVEASLVLTVVIVVIVSLAYLGLIMYHQTLITSTANQTASNIAQVYSNSSKDPVTGYIDVSNLDNDGMVNKMKNQAYADVIKEKAEWYSKYRLAKGNFLKSEEPEIDVKIENKNGALLRAQVVVTVEEDYELPFVQLLGMEKPTIKYKATGRADCYEILDYVNVVEAVDKIDVTENFKVNFYNKDNSLFKTVEVMHDMSIADTMKLSNAEQTKFPADPTLNGQKFYRWKTETGETFDENTVVSGDMNVYAEYDCIVNFMNYDGNAALYQIFAHRNQPFSNSGNSLPAAPPEEGDNKFYCWWYNNAEFTVNTKIPDSDSITVNIRKYLWVKYDGNGGSVSPNRVFVAPGNAIGNMPIPSRGGYSFSGWFNAVNGGTRHYAQTILNSNIWLFAHWTCTHPSSYTVVLNNDCTRYEYKEYCSVCNAELKHKIKHGEHNFNGRCGTDHELIPYRIMATHHGTKSSRGYHIICTKCHQNRMVKDGEYGYYCTEHYVNYEARKTVKDMWWYDNSDLVPGYVCDKPQKQKINNTGG